MASPEQEQQWASSLKKKRRGSLGSRIGSFLGGESKSYSKSSSTNNAAKKAFENKQLGKGRKNNPFHEGLKKDNKARGEKTQQGNTAQTGQDTKNSNLENKSQEGTKENTTKPTGSASGWGNKEWEQMSDSLGQEEQNKSIAPGDGTEQQQSNTGPATDEQIEEQNRPGQEEQDQTEGDDEKNNEKQQSENLKKEKNKKKKKPTEEENLKQNLDAAAKPGAPPQLQALAAASKIPGIGGIMVSIMIKLLHLSRGLQGVGIITVLPALVWPPIIFSYVGNSMVIEWLNKTPMSKAILNTIMVPVNIRKDFQKVLGKENKATEEKPTSNKKKVSGEKTASQQQKRTRNRARLRQRSRLRGRR